MTLLHPIDVLSLDIKLIGYVVCSLWDTFGRSPLPKNVGKSLAIMANGQANGLEFVDYPTMITWRPAIFGGYVELKNEEFFEWPISLKKASKIGLERKVWTFIHKDKRYRVVSLTKDFSELNGRFDKNAIDQICRIEGKDLIQLSSVATKRETRRCIRFDQSVCLNSINAALISATSDVLQSERLLNKGAQASLQALKKTELREDFISRSEEFVSKYLFLIEANDFEEDSQLEIMRREAIEYRLFSNLTRAVFANQFHIGERDNMSTGERLEEFLIGPQLPADAWKIQNVYDSIENKNLRDLKQAIDSFGDIDETELSPRSLILKTANVASVVIDSKRSENS